MYIECLNFCQTSFKSLLTFCNLYNIANYLLPKSPFALKFRKIGFQFSSREIGCPIFWNDQISNVHFVRGSIILNVFRPSKFKFQNFDNVILPTIPTLPNYEMSCKNNWNNDYSWPSPDSVVNFCFHGTSKAFTAILSFVSYLFLLQRNFIL